MNFKRTKLWLNKFVSLMVALSTQLLALILAVIHLKIIIYVVVVVCCSVLSDVAAPVYVAGHLQHTCKLYMYNCVA